MSPGLKVTEMSALQLCEAICLGGILSRPPDSKANHQPSIAEARTAAKELMKKWEND